MKAIDSSRGIWDKVLSAILALLILSALVMLGYSVAVPKTAERFTEFYILGLNGKATNYPAQLMVGEKGEVIAGIVNREQVKTSYRLEVRIDGVANSETGPIALEHKEEWQGRVSFTPNRAGDKQKVEFLLYWEGQEEVYQELHLYVDVR